MIVVDRTAINASMEPPLSSIEFDIDRIAMMYADAMSAPLDGEAALAPHRIDDDVMRVGERKSTRATRRRD